MTPQKKALVLSWFTVLYNLVEGVVSLVFSSLSGSIALTGFGIDSFIESISGIIMIWRFRRHGVMSDEEESRAEALAVKLVGYTFFIFAAYVIFESLRSLLTREPPDSSLPGIIIASVSLITMPALYILKIRTADEIGSKSLRADAKETLACTMLSVSLLIGLGVRYAFGLWWADPVTGLVISYYLIREGWETLEDDDD